MKNAVYINPSLNFTPLTVFQNIPKFILIETSVINDCKYIKNIIKQFLLYDFELTGESIDYLKFKQINTNRIVEYFYSVKLNKLDEVVKHRINLCDTLIYTSATSVDIILQLLPKKFNLVCSSNVNKLDTSLENRIKQAFLLLENNTDDISYVPLGNDFNRLKRIIEDLNLL